MKISIIIPAYNEETIIVDVIRAIKKIITKTKYNYEIIVVDDGSQDKTAEIVEKERVILKKHSYNKGYGAALKTGTKFAKGEYILFIDADGQHKAESILALLEYIDNYDMIVGSRTSKSKIPLLRKPGKKILSMLANYLAEMKIPDLNSGLRIIRKKIIMEFMNILPNTFSFTTTITLACIKKGYNIKYVPVKFNIRKRGKSTIKPFRDGFRFIMLLLRITMLFSPLRVFLPISFFLFTVGFFYGIYGLINLNISDTTILLIISSIMIFFFGLLADQISMLRRDNI